MINPLVVFANLTEEEHATIEKEIKGGTRPKNWNDPYHPDSKVWKALMSASVSSGIAIRI